MLLWLHVQIHPYPIQILDDLHAFVVFVDVIFVDEWCEAVAKCVMVSTMEDAPE